MNVFISRPTWVSSDYSEGLNSFIEFLKSNGFEPHTLGSTDFPVESPLDEVIEMINNSKGVIVLGYPQIKIENGYIKNQKVENIFLPTEWNNIEGVLAYALNKPLLILHDYDISRGIFDRGAVNKFIYEINLKNENWYSDESIKGAIFNWKNKVEQTNEFYEENSLRSYNEELNEDEKRLLFSAYDDSDGSIIVAKSKDGLSIVTNNIEILKNGLGKNRVNWLDSINKLSKLDFIESVNPNNSVYRLTKSGYNYIERNNPLCWLPDEMIEILKETRDSNSSHFIYQSRANGKVLASIKESKEVSIVGERRAFWDDIIEKMIEEDLIEENNNGKYQLKNKGYKLFKSSQS